MIKRALVGAGVCLTICGVITLASCINKKQAQEDIIAETSYETEIEDWIIEETVEEIETTTTEVETESEIEIETEEETTVEEESITETEISIPEPQLITLWALVNVNRRTGPSVDNELVGMLHQGESVLIYDNTLNDEWCLTVDGDYIKREFLSLEEIVIEIPLYTVSGVTCPVEYQEYAYRILCQFGKEWYYPYFLCQMFQESQFIHSPVSANGLDYGLCALRIYYHKALTAECGHPEFDVINDPYANMYVGIYLMSKNLDASGGDIAGALAMYFNSGSDAANAVYVHDVTKWVSTLVQIR